MTKLEMKRLLTHIFIFLFIIKTLKGRLALATHRQMSPHLLLKGIRANWPLRVKVQQNKIRVM